MHQEVACWALAITMSGVQTELNEDDDSPDGALAVSVQAEGCCS